MPSYGAAKYARASEGGAVAVHGFAGLQAALKRIEDGVQPELRRKILEIGAQVALVAAGNAPRDTGQLQHSIKVSAFSRGASVYSTADYGGVQNVGAMTRSGRGPHVKRGRASHYMDKAVTETSPWVEQEISSVLDWLLTTFQE